MLNRRPKRLSIRLTLASVFSATAVAVVCGVALVSLRDVSSFAASVVARQVALLNDTSAFEAVLYHRGFAARANRFFKRSQILTAVGLALSHGSNDAQKTMGIITMGLVAAGAIPEFKVPLWVVSLSAMAIAAGTAVGGWRLIKTIGGKLQDSPHPRLHRPDRIGHGPLHHRGWPPGESQRRGPSLHRLPSSGAQDASRSSSRVLICELPPPQSAFSPSEPSLDEIEARNPPRSPRVSRHSTRSRPETHLVLPG